MARKYMPLVRGQVVEFERNHTEYGGQYYGRKGQKAIVEAVSYENESQVVIRLIEPHGDQSRTINWIYKRFFYQVKPYHPDQEDEDDCL